MRKTEKFAFMKIKAIELERENTSLILKKWVRKGLLSHYFFRFTIDLLIKMMPAFFF